MSEMIERVARAICEADNHGWPDDDYNGRTQRRFYEKQARAAIAAMREPTGSGSGLGMEEAGGDECAKAFDKVDTGKFVSCDGTAVAVWRAMIDEALK